MQYAKVQTWNVKKEHLRESSDHFIWQKNQNNNQRMGIDSSGLFSPIKHSFITIFAEQESQQQWHKDAVPDQAGELLGTAIWILCKKMKTISLLETFRDLCCLLDVFIYFFCSVILEESIKTVLSLQVKWYFSIYTFTQRCAFQNPVPLRELHCDRLKKKKKNNYKRTSAVYSTDLSSLLVLLHKEDLGYHCAHVTVRTFVY